MFNQTNKSPQSSTFICSKRTARPSHASYCIRHFGAWGVLGHGSSDFLSSPGRRQFILMMHSEQKQ